MVFHQKSINLSLLWLFGFSHNSLPPLIRQLNFQILTAFPYLRLSLTRNRRYPLFWKNSRRLSKPYQIIYHSNGVRLNSYLADSANIAFSTKATVWCTKPFLDWLPWSWLPKGSHLISSCTDKSNIPATFMMFSWVHIKFLQTHHTQLHKKEDYRHLHGAVREYMINLKERSQVSMSHLDQLLMTLCSMNLCQTQPLPIPPHMRTWMSPRILYF